MAPASPVNEIVADVLLLLDGCEAIAGASGIVVSIVRVCVEGFETLL